MAAGRTSATEAVRLLIEGLEKIGSLEMKPEEDFRVMKAGEFMPISELGLEEPYVLQFKDRYREWPTLQLQKFKQLPVRYRDSVTGKYRFKMQPFKKGEVFTVTGTEPGKRAPVLIVVTDFSGKQLLLEPKMVAGVMHIGIPGGSSTDDERHRRTLVDEFEEGLENKAKPRSEMAEIVQARKMKARFVI
jgi:hypothetical protein